MPEGRGLPAWGCWSSSVGGGGRERERSGVACDSAGLSKSERVIFGLSGLGGRCGSGLTSSEETLEMETSLSGSGVRGICLPEHRITLTKDTTNLGSEKGKACTRLNHFSSRNLTPAQFMIRH